MAKLKFDTKLLGDGAMSSYDEIPKSIMQSFGGRAWVKVRATLAEAMDAIAKQSERRIEAAADLWLARQPDHARLSLRFDMVAILPRRWPVHVPNIFAGGR